jgi:flagellar biosynthesis anti-sigma factor FlgM
MSIEIKGYPQQTPVESGPKAHGRPVVTTGEQPTGVMPQTDRVTLSDAALQMGRQEQSASKIPVFDSQRVASLKQAIHEHDYDINPERISEKFQYFGNALQGST